MTEAEQPTPEGIRDARLAVYREIAPLLPELRRIALVAASLGETPALNSLLEATMFVQEKEAI